MRRFLVRVDRSGIAPAPVWRESPSTTWRDISGRVRAWVWGEAVHDRPASDLSFRSTITHEVTADDIGPHVNVRLEARGFGTIEPDVIGLHPLYAGEIGNETFASNCPHRVAEALLSQGATVRRSLTMSALLASCERPFGLGTGFDEVSCAAAGEMLTIDRNQGIRCTPTVDVPWTANDDILLGTEVNAVIDDCVDEMIERIERWISLAPSRPVLLLTGGLDSRLVLALVIAAGRLDDVDAVTYGVTRSPDVVAASELAKKLGIPHTVRPPQGLHGLRDHVRRTAGMLSCRMRSESEPDDSIILHGLLGETLRSNIRTNRPIRTRDQLIAWWIQPHAHAGLVQREAQISVLTQGLKELLQPLDAGLRPETGLDVFYIQHSVRRWISARPDFFRNKIFPLYSPRAMALALRLGWMSRRDAVIHETVIARVGGPLLDVPYARDNQPQVVPELSSLGGSSSI